MKKNHIQFPMDSFTLTQSPQLHNCGKYLELQFLSTIVHISLAALYISNRHAQVQKPAQAPRTPQTLRAAINAPAAGCAVR